MALKFKNDPARTAALAGDLTRYEGRTCDRCQGTERYTSSGACVTCVKARATERSTSIRVPRYKPKEDSARGAALAAEEITYIGPPCITCTSTERYTSSGGCVHCTKAANLQKNDGRPRRNYRRLTKTGLDLPLEPADGKCEVCGNVAKLVADHDHVLEALGFPGSETFRGWLCYRCNNGIGLLGDNVAGLMLRVAYLQKFGS
jgi:hypothetical protein